MKKFVFVTALLALQMVHAQKKKFAQILTTNNIALIEDFLKTAHPEDPRRIVLKPRLQALKNMAWAKSGSMNYADRKPVAMVVTTTPDPALRIADEEEKEFNMLLAESKAKRDGIASEVLNQIFNADEKSQESVLMIRNDSDCNMIMNILGDEDYKLAIPAHQENSILVAQGDYTLESSVCEAKYQSVKKIVGMIQVSLSNPARSSNIIRNADQLSPSAVPVGAGVVH